MIYSCVKRTFCCSLAGVVLWSFALGSMLISCGSTKEEISQPSVGRIQAPTAAPAVPGDDIRAALPDLAFAGRQPSTFYHVAPTGSDTAPGTETEPWKTLEKAMKTVQAGEGVLVHTGDYPEHIKTLSAGKPDRPIWLKAAPGEAARLVGSQPGVPYIRITHRYWIVDGLEIDATGSYNPATPWQPAILVQNTDHVLLRKLRAHHGGGPYAVGIFGGQDVALFDSTIYEFSWPQPSGEPKDSHGVVVGPDSLRVHVRANDSWGHSGDSVQCVGADHAEGTGHPSHLTIEENRYGNRHRDQTPRPSDRENAVDIKTCHHVTIRANKLFGYRPTGTAPGGAALVLHYGADRILVEWNRFWDNGLAASMGSASNSGLGSVVFTRNLLFDSTTDQNGAGWGLRVGPARAIQLYHNTFFNIPGDAVRLGDDGPISEAAVANNIFEDIGGLAIHAVLSNLQMLSSDRNLFWNAPLVGGWPHDSSSIHADPLFVANPRSNDFYTQPGSPARDVAIPLGYSYQGSGPDIGFLESP